MKQKLMELLASTMDHDDEYSETPFTDGKHTRHKADCRRCKLEKWARGKVLRGEEEREELSKKLQTTEDERERMEIIAAMLAIAKVRRELVGDDHERT